MTKAKDDKTTTPPHATKDDDASAFVVLKCIYSGNGESANPDDVIEVDAEEAARLIGLGAAVAAEVSLPAADEQPAT